MLSDNCAAHDPKNVKLGFEAEEKQELDYDMIDNMYQISEVNS